MGFPIFDIEVTGPLPQLPLSRLEQGCALLIRRSGRPVEFLLPEDVLAGDGGEGALARLIALRAGKQILAAAIHEELLSRTPEIDPPSVTAVICTHDRPAYAARCLASLRDIVIPDGFPSTHLSMLVVDNAPSDDQTRAVVEEFPGVRYICEKKPGLDFARNRAWQEATGWIVAFLDDDVVVDRGWLQGLLEAYRVCPTAAGFTGLVLPYELETEAQLLFEKRGGFRRGFERIVFGQRMPLNPLYPAGAGIFGAGANMAFVRDVLERIGGFDEALDTGAPLPGGGDLDMFYRIVRSGYAIVYEPRYLVFHQHRREIAALRRQYKSWGLGMMSFVAKAHRTDPAERKKILRLVAWWMRYQVRLLLRGLRGQRQFRPDFVLAEMLGGLIGLCGEYDRSLRRVGEIRRRFP